MNKQETLEEAIERIFNIPEDKTGDVYFGSNIAHLRKGFKLGVKWQQEQDKKLYSEEEAFNLLEQAMLDSFLILNKKDLVKWFERNKKK